MTAIPIGRVVLPIEAFLVAGACSLFGLPFLPSAGLVAVVVVTDVAHILARGLRNIGRGDA